MKPTSIELFAGCGGMALGFEEYFDHIMLNDFDKSACESLKLNRPEWNVIHDDVRNVIDKYNPGCEVDVLTGGFPCQSFSVAGKQRGFDDIRGTLFFEFCRAINKYRPKMFVGENVTGILYNDKGRTINTIMNTLHSMDYMIAVNVLYAPDYGAAQRRKRVIFVGLRKDLKDKWGYFDWPAKLTEYKTIQDAFDRIKDDDPYQVHEKLTDWKQEWLDSFPPTYETIEYPATRTYKKKAKRRPFNGIASTITTQLHRINWYEMTHPTINRFYTTREVARLMTFPDDWQLSGSHFTKIHQLGNAVCPVMANALAKSVYNCIINT